VALSTMLAPYTKCSILAYLLSGVIITRQKAAATKKKFRRRQLLELIDLQYSAYSGAEDEIDTKQNYVSAA